jgi:hypothetical protein
MGIDDGYVAAPPSSHSKEAVPYLALVAGFLEGPSKLALAAGLHRPSFHGSLFTHTLKAVSSFVLITFFQEQYSLVIPLVAQCVYELQGLVLGDICERFFVAHDIS